MNLFKIKIEPKVKDRAWEVRNIGSNRKEKICEVCKKKMKVGGPSTTFTKRVTMGSKTGYQTFHTCNHNVTVLCAEVLAERLGIDLDKSWVH